MLLLLAGNAKGKFSRHSPVQQTWTHTVIVLDKSQANRISQLFFGQTKIA
jgi:hypothetical protein